jgi:hypothetical protein
MQAGDWTPLAEQPLAGTWLRVTGPGQLVAGQPLQK